MKRSLPELADTPKLDLSFPPPLHEHSKYLGLADQFLANDGSEPNDDNQPPTFSTTVRSTVPSALP
jgi:hypothetical protein